MHAVKVNDQEIADHLTVAVLEHLTGPSRGTVTWLGDAGLNVSLDESRRLNVHETTSKVPATDTVARLRRSDGSFEIEALPGHVVWVNGRQVSQKRLVNHDMIEFGETGPMSRFCLCGKHQPIRAVFPGIVGDSLAYFRSSRRPFIGKLARTILLTLSRLIFETTYVFRIGVIVAFLALGFVTYQQSKMNSLLSERISRGASQMEEFARTLSRNRDEAVTPSELEALGRELGNRVETAAERLERLERRSTASARIIRQHYRSVVMIQSAYGFRDKATGRFLRQVLGEDGKPRIYSNGLLMLSLEGNGPTAERQFIGTAFLIGEAGLLVTNRHVGNPWEQDAVLAPMLDQGLEPVLLKLLAYVPGIPAPVAARVIAASDEDDLALLRLAHEIELIQGFELAKREPRPGEEIIVMGYPTGLRSLLAQAGQEFVEIIQKSGEMGFWSVAESLAKAGKVAPLASRGILGRVNADNLVYDAETTHGGSGGPVVDIEGYVIAVNTAILPEYGGSNLGIPVARIEKLLESAEFPALPEGN